MNYLRCSFVFILFALSLPLSAQVDKKDIDKAIDINSLQHPYLYFTEEEKASLYHGDTTAQLRGVNSYDSVKTYFENSILNMVTGSYNEKPEATDAKKTINLILKNAYAIISHADIKTYTASTPSVSVKGSGKNINLILNIFNLGRNHIKPDAAIDYIDRAIAVYKANRVASLIRVINPFFWMYVALKYR